MSDSEVPTSPRESSTSIFAYLDSKNRFIFALLIAFLTGACIAFIIMNVQLYGQSQKNPVSTLHVLPMDPLPAYSIIIAAGFDEVPIYSALLQKDYAKHGESPPFMPVGRLIKIPVFVGSMKMNFIRIDMPTSLSTDPVVFETLAWNMTLPESFVCFIPVTTTDAQLANASSMSELNTLTGFKHSVITQTSILVSLSATETDMKLIGGTLTQKASARIVQTYSATGMNPVLNPFASSSQFYGALRTSPRFNIYTSERLTYQYSFELVDLMTAIFSIFNICVGVLFFFFPRVHQSLVLEQNRVFAPCWVEDKTDNVGPSTNAELTSTFTRMQ
jgi:hypothetical protein